MRPKIFLVISDPLLTDTLHVAFQSNGLDVVEAVSQAHKLDLLLLNIQPDVLVVEQTLLLNLSELEKTIDLKVIKAVCLLSDLNFYFISEWQEKGIDGFAHRINGFEELRNCISSVIVAFEETTSSCRFTNFSVTAAAPSLIFIPAASILKPSRIVPAAGNAAWNVPSRISPRRPDGRLRPRAKAATRRTIRRTPA